MHLMIDIETLGVAPGSLILSIGAVMFDPLSEALGPEFYVNVDPADAQARGLTIEAGTVDWWFRQSDQARGRLMSMRLPLQAALQGLAAFCGSHKAERVWGHGATFDPVLLDAAYRTVGLPTPWTPWIVRDTRTLYELAGVKPDRAAGVHHTALDDAVNQARAAQLAYRRLGWERETNPVREEAVRKVRCPRCDADLRPGDIHVCLGNKALSDDALERLASQVRDLPGKVLEMVSDAAARTSTGARP